MQRKLNEAFFSMFSADFVSFIGFFVFQVSLGKSNELLAADYNADKLPQGCHSVKGLGKVAPNPEENITM